MNGLHYKRWEALRIRRLGKLPLTDDEASQVEMLDLLCHWRDRFGTRIVSV